MLDKLFKFPVIRADEAREQAKRTLALPSEEDESFFIAVEAEYPYYDFVGVEDAWMPDDRESFDMAKDGKFKYCLVRFNHMNAMLVPWSKKKFKNELLKFVESLNIKEEEEGPALTFVPITPEQLEQIMKDNQSKEDSKNEENKDE